MSEPQTESGKARSCVRIVQLPGSALDALADADLDGAVRACGLPLTSYFVGPECLGTWRLRSRQVRTDPESAAWVTGVVWDETNGTAVGRAGYHGPPDARGMVEVGYAVNPVHRRRGHARGALEALLARAAEEPAVRVVRAAVRPDNTASRSLILQYGFREVGEQWDDEDGLETIYETTVG